MPGTAGSIGYAEFSYVVANHLTAVQLENAAGRFVSPTDATIAAAAEHGDWTVPTFAADLTDMPGDESWPIVTTTFVLIPTTPSKAATSHALLRFFVWAFAHGDAAARALHYVPLPETVKAKIEGSWGRQ